MEGQILVSHMVTGVRERERDRERERRLSVLTTSDYVSMEYKARSLSHISSLVSERGRERERGKMVK